MSFQLPRTFPASFGAADYNPAIRLFGKRFFIDQGGVELLAEFLAIALCGKRLSNGVDLTGHLPSPADIASWPGKWQIEYKPPVKLNLKLFALLGASRVETRHEAHREQHSHLSKLLASRIDASDQKSVARAVGWIEELLQGFQGAGFNRGWCAQTFFPVSSSLITQETIWNDSVAKREPVSHWELAIHRFHKYFTVSRHRFLARGGELLYLQLCNALFRNKAEIDDFVARLRADDPGSISDDESDPMRLHALLEQGLSRLRGSHTAPFDRLVDFVEGLDPETSRRVNEEPLGAGWLSCEWCPEESWREGYLFAVELSRLLSAGLDPVERLNLLITGCALQVLRSLSAQSARYAPAPAGIGAENLLGYAWLFTPRDGASKPLRLAAQRNLEVVLGQIQQALRTPALRENARKDPDTRMTEEKLYKEADTKYGHKMFISQGKKLGIIVPYQGPGPRFTMTDGMLRYLVLTLMRPGERSEYDDFLRRLYFHYGVAIEGEQLARAVAWTGLPANRTVQPEEGWLAEALRAGGFLAELSDACSIVRNSYEAGKNATSGVNA
ncbi:MAG: hypothetical protein ACOX87_08830 [Chloroflexota bacterium]|jgi:hypothetical protein